MCYSIINENLGTAQDEELQTLIKNEYLIQNQVKYLYGSIVLHQIESSPQRLMNSYQIIPLISAI